MDKKSHGHLNSEVCVSWHAYGPESATCHAASENVQRCYYDATQAPQRFASRGGLKDAVMTFIQHWRPLYPLCPSYSSHMSITRRCLVLYCTEAVAHYTSENVALQWLGAHLELRFHNRVQVWARRLSLSRESNVRLHAKHFQLPCVGLQPEL